MTQSLTYMVDIGLTQIVELFSMLTVVLGAFHTIHKVKKDQREDRAFQKNEILKEAFDYSDNNRKTLEAKIESLRKDVDHIKEKQAGEIRVLGEKIEDLRSELRTQHGQLIALVTKLVDKT